MILRQAQDSSTRSATIALIVVQVLFASLGVVAKLVLRELAPWGLIAVRVPVAALLFLAVWVAQGRERVAPADLARIAVYALFGIVANQLLFIAGLERTSATNAVVLGASIPVFTVGVAILSRRERATPLKLAGLGLALLGALTVTGLFHGAPSLLSGGRALVGNLLVLCNSLSFSIYLVISRDVLARYRPMTVVTFTFVFGALGVLPFGIVDFVHAAPQLSTLAWLGIAYIILFASVGTYFLNAWALARVESSMVATYIFLQPVLGALLASVVLDERPTPSTIAGGLGIFAGIWLVSRDARARRASVET